MKPFLRILSYIKPQWPRIIVVVVSAMTVSILLSLSFMTIIPLLKVIMGEEGLHGWVDRKTCEWRYGMNFYVPDITDFTDGTDKNIAHYLLVTRVNKNSLAETAGFKSADRIVGAGTLLISQGYSEVTSARLLQELAAAGEDEITVQLKRLDEKNTLEDKATKLNKAEDKAHIENMHKGVVNSVKHEVASTVIKRAQWLVSFLPRDQARENKTKAVIFIIVLMGVVTVFRCGAKFCQDYLAEKVVQIGVNHLREDAFGHAVNMPIGFFATERVSDVVSRVMGDTGVMGRTIKVMLGKALREPLNAVFFLAAAMWLNWQLVLIFLCSAPLTLGLLAVLGKKMKRASTKSLMAGSQMLGKLQETMAGLKVVKVYNQEKYERRIFGELNQKLLKQLLKISRVDAATNPAMEVLGMAAGSAALLVGAHWIAQRNIEPAEFLTLLIFLGSAAEAVRKTSDIWNKIQEANAAAERVFAIMDEPAEFEKPNAIKLPPFRDKIEFRNVVFIYPGGSRPVLNGVDLTVKTGHNVAIVGPNGSGKTTLVNLIPRFYSPNSGSILIDGQDISEVTLSSLRNQIGMVTQNVVVFNDTIKANILYGRPGAADEEVIAAAKRAFAHEFISPLPSGYDTIIGEQGAGLSGGQLQRIVIARAILKNAAILIFDEATSQVDADSEAKIHKAIEEVMKNRTSFIIAHRFSTIIKADIIVVMDDGRIVAQGQHEELMRTSTLYQNLYKTQLLVAQ